MPCLCGCCRLSLFLFLCLSLPLSLPEKCKVPPPNNNPAGKPGFALYRQDLIIYYTEWAPLKVIGNGTIRREAIGMYGRVLKVLLLHEYSHKLRT